MTDLLTELEALAEACDYDQVDGYSIASALRTLIAAEKARGPDPLLVRARDALENARGMAVRHHREDGCEECGVLMDEIDSALSVVREGK